MGRVPTQSPQACIGARFGRAHPCVDPAGFPAAGCWLAAVCFSALGSDATGVAGESAPVHRDRPARRWCLVCEAFSADVHGIACCRHSGSGGWPVSLRPDFSSRCPLVVPLGPPALVPGSRSRMDAVAAVAPAGLARSASARLDQQRDPPAVEPFQSSNGNNWPAVPLAAGALLTALTYFTAPLRATLTPARAVLMWVGGLALVPSAVTWAVVATGLDRPAWGQPHWLSLLVWVVVLGCPLTLGWWLRPHRFWPLALAAIWMILDCVIQVEAVRVLSFLWWGSGAVGLMVWGSAESRAERVNLGTVLLATTLLGFYFTEVIARFDRSLGLLGLGLFFLIGGWGLNRLRQALLPKLPPPSASTSPMP